MTWTDCGGLVPDVGNMKQTPTMADWSLLRAALVSVEDSLALTWTELDGIVGGLPASASKHRAWWSGDRPHVNTWRSAGFTVSNLRPGVEVTFVRAGPPTPPPAARRSRPPVPASDLPSEPAAPTLLLVSCVKHKLDRPAAARDLYVSDLFRKGRTYAERSGLPWLILSAEHGLVAPDEWLAPYDRYLPETPASFRRAWGMWVSERLELLAGNLRGQTIEIHAGSAYVDALRSPLASKGASLFEPLAGLAMGQRRAWYGNVSTRPDDGHETSATSHESTAGFCEQLADAKAAATPGEFLARGPTGLKMPGLYSWWVDPAGAADLSTGLGQPPRPRPDLCRPGRGNPLAKRSPLLQHTVVANLRHAPRWEARVFHLPTHPWLNPDQRPTRAENRRSKTHYLDERSPQGDCRAVRRRRHARPA